MLCSWPIFQPIDRNFFLQFMSQHHHPPGLPAPDPQAAAHSARLTEMIHAEILAAGGSIPFARFMELALYAPGLGYYRTGTRKFGPDGDFITAPETSSLFSRCIARQCREVLSYLEGGDILELGAGSGVMAADILRELESLESLPGCYQILEVSGELRERQQATLAARVPHLVDRVRWLETFPRPGFRGMVIGNEVLDAMPVQRFRITPHGPVPLHVTWEENVFSWCEGPPDADLTARVDGLQSELDWRFPPGYESEFNPYLDAWLETLAGTLEAGALLFIDYGYPHREYYHPQRTTGTLICHYRHRVHGDSLILPGLQDITANVDFSALAGAGAGSDLEVTGYTSQACFLIGCGLEELLADADPTDTTRYLDLARQVKLLTLPGEMGDRFKALALTRNLTIPLRGFAFFDQRDRL